MSSAFNSAIASQILRIDLLIWSGMIQQLLSGWKAQNIFDSFLDEPKGFMFSQRTIGLSLPPFAVKVEIEDLWIQGAIIASTLFIVFLLVAVNFPLLVLETLRLPDTKE